MEHDRHPLRPVPEDRKGVLLRLTGVDHDGQLQTPRKVDLRLERASLILARREVAEVVEAGLADRAQAPTCPKIAVSNESSSRPSAASNRVLESGRNGCSRTETARSPSARPYRIESSRSDADGSFASCHGACSCTYRLSARTSCHASWSATVTSTESKCARTCSGAPSNSALSSAGGSASGTIPSRYRAIIASVRPARFPYSFPSSDL